jgi:hypothetical protein
MSKVKCDWDTCRHNVDGCCQAEEIILETEDIILEDEGLTECLTCKGYERS